MKYACSILLALVSLLLFTSIAHAQVVINEFSPNSSTEWVELYNAGSNSVDLTNWTLTDSANHVKTLTGSVNANGYFVYEEASGWLNNTGSETITLKDAASTQVDVVTYGSGSITSPDSDKCDARTPDGSSTWTSNISCTKNSTNPAAPTATPTATPASATATPTSTPIATATSTPTAKPTPTKTPTPKPTATATDKPTESPLVLGNSTEESPTASPVVEIESNTTTKKLPIIAVGMIILGSIFIGFPVWTFIKSRKVGYNNPTNENS